MDAKIREFCLSETWLGITSEIVDTYFDCLDIDKDFMDNAVIEGFRLWMSNEYRLEIHFSRKRFEREPESEIRRTRVIGPESSLLFLLEFSNDYDKEQVKLYRKVEVYFVDFERIFLIDTFLKALKRLKIALSMGKEQKDKEADEKLKQFREYVEATEEVIKEVNK